MMRSFPDIDLQGERAGQLHPRVANGGHCVHFIRTKTTPRAAYRMRSSLRSIAPSAPRPPVSTLFPYLDPEPWQNVRPIRFR
jgi:hypothetical protein